MKQPLSSEEKMQKIRQNFAEAQRILAGWMEDPASFPAFQLAGDLMSECLASGGKIISCGNGGSLCDAMHFAEELSGRFRKNRRPLPAIAVSDPAYLTCTANDYGYEEVFSRFVAAFGKPGDILLAISTSGNSVNVLKAAEAARQAGMEVVALTGKDGGALSHKARVELRIGWEGYSDRIQELHILLLHSLVQYIEMSLGEEAL